MSRPPRFPARLPEQCLRLHGLDRIGLVVDPFLGLGSSALAAARVGARFVGIEMDESYLAKRWRGRGPRARKASESPDVAGVLHAWRRWSTL